MMASNREQASTSTAGRQSQETPSEMSNPTSPTDTRHPVSRYESITQSHTDGLSSSFQSTDTVRRRSETQQGGYGT